ncbi:MAG: hypothetical protein K2W86_16205 [Sphingomonas sp.]|uniref:hypothetical protein n=1 Tax=Sphingomonas sp. TaxID=28214 RepID=UPI0035A96950|nr:hypothetical protein [Sphingomonas sp.]
MPRSAASKAQPPTSTDMVERISDELDELLYAMRLGHPTQREHERQADVAHDLADRLRAVFRAPTVRQPKPVHPPLFQSPCGERAAW